MSVDTTRLRFGDVIAGAAGVLLFLSLFLTWYSLGGLGDFDDFSGWEALGVIDALLFLVAAAAVGVAVLRALGAVPPRLPLSPGLVVLALGALAVVLVLFRLLVAPDYVGLFEVERSIGIFVALIAAAGVTLGGWLTWNEEGRPQPQSTGPPSSPSAPPPPPEPPQATEPPPPPGGAADWYPDPRGESRLRYWDGTRWTQHVAD